VLRTYPCLFRAVIKLKNTLEKRKKSKKSYGVRVLLYPALKGKIENTLAGRHVLAQSLA